jgi:hypothetical protein
MRLATQAQRPLPLQRLPVCRLLLLLLPPPLVALCRL